MIHACCCLSLLCIHLKNVFIHLNIKQEREREGLEPPSGICRVGDQTQDLMLVKSCALPTGHLLCHFDLVTFHYHRMIPPITVYKSSSSGNM